jgi:ribonuclease HI/pterin-4a-carbinolamine dehydratase
MWQEKNNSLYREFVFKDFDQAFSFMQAVAAEAVRLQHHPRWENDYNKVRIWLTTHSQKDTITKQDIGLSRAIDLIYDGGQSDKLVDKNTTALTEVKLYTDGGSRGNPGPSASGYVLLDMNDKVIIERGIYLGVTTNNQAEYKALKFGLEEAKNMKASRVDVYMDSLLIVNQMLGHFKVKNGDLRPLHENIKKLIESFERVKFTHVPRELNKLADAMVNKALDKELAV